MDTRYTVRAATRADADRLFELIRGLADYERLTHKVTGSAARLREHLFGPRPYAEALVAEDGGASIGFALFVVTYSTFLTAPGLWLEDLFIEPAHRGRGVGSALFARVAEIARERGCAQLEWAVLDWNEPAIRFYRARGASVLPDWRMCRITGDDLARLAAS